MIFMTLAQNLMGRSTCARLKVGCVIVSDDYQFVHGIGYNGNAKGFPNLCDSDEPGKCGCLHAEDNAVIKCRAPAGQKLRVFCTHNPCVMCAKRLVNLGGVLTLHYGTEYRSTEGIAVLQQAGIEVFDRIEMSCP
jgi:dCMP deaminase